MMMMLSIGIIDKGTQRERERDTAVKGHCSHECRANEKFVYNTKHLYGLEREKKKRTALNF